MEMKNKWIILTCLCSLVGIYQGNRLRNVQQENERLRVELAHAQICAPLQVDTIHDSIPVYQAPVIVVDKSSYKKEMTDKKLLKEMSVKSGQVETQQRTESVTSDSIKLLSRNDKKTFSYKDRWAEFHLSLCDTTLTYSVRDSITTIVYREYKHRFLWWKWGTKGYKVKVVNFNPHSTLLYNQYIKIDH